MAASAPGGSTSPPTNGVTGRGEVGFTIPLFGVVVSLPAVADTPRHNATITATTASTAVCRTARSLVMAPRSRTSSLRKESNRDRDADRPPVIDYLAAVTEIVEIVSQNR